MTEPDIEYVIQLLAEFRPLYDSNNWASSLLVLDKTPKEIEKCMIIRGAFTNVIDAEITETSIPCMLLQVSQTIAASKQPAMLLKFHYLVGHSDLLMDKLSYVVLSPLLRMKNDIHVLTEFINETLKYRNQHLVAGLELYTSLGIDPKAPSDHVPITIFLEALLPKRDEKEVASRPRLAYDQLIAASKSKHRLSFLSALGDAGLLDPFLEDSEFQRTLLLFSGMKAAQKLLFTRKYPGTVEAGCILGSQIVSCLGYAAAAAVGVCVCVKSKTDTGVLNGWMLVSGILYALVQVLICVALLSLESQALTSLLSIFSVLAAGMLYIHVSLPKAIGWADLGAKIVSVMISSAESTQSFLLARVGVVDLSEWIGSFNLGKYLPHKVLTILTELQPVFIYVRLFVLPVSWPLLPCTIAGLTLGLIWSGNLSPWDSSKS